MPTTKFALQQSATEMCWNWVPGKWRPFMFAQRCSSRLL